jgi:hypothetical protein
VQRTQFSKVYLINKCSYVNVTLTYPREEFCAILQSLLSALTFSIRLSCYCFQVGLQMWIALPSVQNTMQKLVFRSPTADIFSTPQLLELWLLDSDAH